MAKHPRTILGQSEPTCDTLSTRTNRAPPIYVETSMAIFMPSPNLSMGSKARTNAERVHNPEPRKARHPCTLLERTHMRCNNIELMPWDRGDPIKPPAHNCTNLHTCRGLNLSATCQNTDMAGGPSRMHSQFANLGNRTRISCRSS
jgi:hypothetical protein